MSKCVQLSYESQLPRDKIVVEVAVLCMKAFQGPGGERVERERGRVILGKRGREGK